MGTLRIGTCSWKYPSWEGLVYSSREPGNFLAEYARKYDTVEVDQWFWSLGRSGAGLPRRETVLEYDAAVPPEFRFTVKCPNALTLTRPYARKGETAEPNPRFLDPGFFHGFLDALAPLVPKVGLFLFQFEYLNKDKIPGREAFLERLGIFLETLPGDLPYGVEIRNPRWIDAGWFDFLAKHGAAPVLLQGYWVEDLAGILARHGGRIRGRVCLRLLGEDREGMEERTGEDWSRIVRPKDEDLARIVPELETLVDALDEVYLNVNNHYEGSAPLTIDKIRRSLNLPEGEHHGSRAP